MIPGMMKAGNSTIYPSGSWQSYNSMSEMLSIYRVETNKTVKKKKYTETLFILMKLMG